MKKIFLILIFTCLLFIAKDMNAQCSICNKTVQQMGAKPAQGFNSGILYLMAVPYLAVGFIGYKWWRSRQGQD